LRHGSETTLCAKFGLWTATELRPFTPRSGLAVKSVGMTVLCDEQTSQRFEGLDRAARLFDFSGI
jgi:hypothetical protein